MPTTQAEVAKHLGVAQRTVRELRDRQVIPDPAKSTLSRVRLAYIRHLRELAAGRQGDRDLAEENLKLARSKREAQELKTSQLRGELVPVDQVETTMIAVSSTMRQKVLAVPSKAAPEAHAAQSIAETEEVLRRHVTEALEDVAATAA